MPGWLIALLTRWILPNIVEFFVAFLTNLQAARADDQSALATVEQIVLGLERDHPDWDGAQKREYAFDAARRYFMNAGKDVSSSLVNTLIELVVQKAKTQQDAGVPPDAAHTIGSVP